MGLVVEASTSTMADVGSIPAFAVGVCPGRMIPVTQKFNTQWQPSQAAADVSSTLGLVGPVSVYCDWAR